MPQAAGAPASAPSAAGPPLLWAAGQAHADCVAALLKAGADANARSGEGVTALVMLAALGHGVDGAAQCARLLAQAGADVNVRHAGGSGRMACACVSPAALTVRGLRLSRRVKPGGGGDEFTALHVAADMGSRDVLSALLEAGADANAADASSNRPIDLAAAAGDEARGPNGGSRRRSPSLA